MRKLTIYLSFGLPFILGGLYASTIDTTGGTGSITTTGGTGSISTTMPGSAAETITYDTTTFSGAPTGGASPLAWNITVGSCSDRMLIVGCATDFDRNVTGITYDSNAMTYGTNTYRTGGQQTGTWMYYYPNPASGSKSVSVSWSGGGSNNGITCMAIDFCGVKQSGTVDVTSGTYYTASTITGTLVTGTDNDLLVDVVYAQDQVASATAGASQGIHWNVYNSNHSFSLLVSTKQVTTAGSYDMTWANLNGTVNNQQSLMAIKQGP